MVEYYITNDAQPVTPADPLWTASLPVTRSGTGAPGATTLRYGDYFRAVHQFLTENDFDNLRNVLALAGDGPALDPANPKIRIYLEKHGRFYHPARVVVVWGTNQTVLAANVAATPDGISLMAKERRVLEQLGREFDRPLVSRLIGGGDIVFSGNRPVSIMLTEWLAGFHEFHLSAIDSFPPQTVVWAPAGVRSLSIAQQTEVYTQAAAILTYYYDLETGNQIYPWHHAAGDFVVNLDGEGPQVRLITARQYAAMMTVDCGDPASIMNALLVFFLNLSIRMRLDRLDGTGATVWAADNVLAATVDGFFRTLAHKANPAGFDQPLARETRAYFSTFTGAELYQIAAGLCDSYHPEAPDLPVIRTHLRDHTARLAELLTVDSAQPRAGTT